MCHLAPYTLPTPPNTTTSLPPWPSYVFSINLDLSGEQVSSPGQRLLRLFFTVCLATQHWTSGLSPNWLGTDPHDMSICETRPCSTWKNQEAAEHHSALSDCQEKGWVKFFNWENRENTKPRKKRSRLKGCQLERGTMKKPTRASTERHLWKKKITAQG